METSGTKRRKLDDSATAYDWLGNMRQCYKSDGVTSFKSRTHFEILGLNFWMRKFSDVTLVCGNRRIPCHRMILSAASKYFSAMFDSGMNEAHQKEILIQGIDPDAFQTLISFCYSGRLDLEQLSVQSVLSGASMLQLTDVIHACNDFLNKQLDPSNCLGIRSFADAQGCERLQQSAHEFTLEHIMDVMQQSEFPLLPVEEVVPLLGSDHLNVTSEVCVYQAICLWIEHNIAERQSLAGQLLQTLRLPLLPPEFIVDNIKNNPLFRENRACQNFIVETLKYRCRCCRKPTLPFFDSRARPRKSISIGNLTCQCKRYGDFTCITTELTIVLPNRREYQLELRKGSTITELRDRVAKLCPDMAYEDLTMFCRKQSLEDKTTDGKLAKLYNYNFRDFEVVTVFNKQPVTSVTRSGHTDHRIIFTIQEGDDWKLRLADALINFSEVSVEGQRYDKAQEVLELCLAMQKELLPTDDRLIAECHFKLGRLFNMTAKCTEGAAQFGKARAVLNDRLGRYREAVNEDSKTKLKKEIARGEDVLLDIEDQIDHCRDRELEKGKSKARKKE